MEEEPGGGKWLTTEEAYLRDIWPKVALNVGEINYGSSAAELLSELYDAAFLTAADSPTAEKAIAQADAQWGVAMSMYDRISRTLTSRKNDSSNASFETIVEAESGRLAEQIGQEQLGSETGVKPLIDTIDDLKAAFLGESEVYDAETLSFKDCRVHNTPPNKIRTRVIYIRFGGGMAGAFMRLPDLSRFQVRRTE
jgi:hypothetical protein